MVEFVDLRIGSSFLCPRPVMPEPEYISSVRLVAMLFFDSGRLPGKTGCSGDKVAERDGSLTRLARAGIHHAIAQGRLSTGRDYETETGYRPASGTPARCRLDFLQRNPRTEPWHRSGPHGPGRAVTRHSLCEICDSLE